MHPILFLDAASPTVHVGLQVSDAEAPEWRRATDQAGVGLFREVDVLIRARGVALVEMRTVVYCEGPGSLLGVRLVAMALRTWGALPRPTPLSVLGYRSLELVAAGLLAGGTPGPFHVIVDGRRATWNALSVDAEGRWGAIRRRPAAEAFPSGEPVFHPAGFPLWQALPTDAATIPYEPAALTALARRFSLLQPVALPDAFMTEMPTYREWTPEHPVRPS